MSRTIFFATLHEPQFRHEVAFDSYRVNKNSYSNDPNIESVTINYYSRDGNLIGAETPNFLQPVCEIAQNIKEPCLVFLEFQYRFIPPTNVYAFVTKAETGEGITYPMSPAIGFPETQVWFNRGVFPVGATFEGWSHEVFLANPSRWATMRAKLLLYSGGKIHTIPAKLQPKQNTIFNLSELSDSVGLEQVPDVVGAIARNKPIIYILGRNEKTRSLSFIEHVVTAPRNNFIIPKPDIYDLSVENSGHSRDKVFCFCNGMNLKQALENESEGLVGNYCTACRDDLRSARQEIGSQPSVESINSFLQNR